MTRQKKAALYASTGPVLTHYEVDCDEYALVKRGSLTLPKNVEYVWPHASKRILYVTCSSKVSRDNLGSDHWICALNVDEASGDLSFHGEPVRLAIRPLHVTTDSSSRHLLVAFNNPSDLWIFRIKRDGTIGERIAQRTDIDHGVFAHQVRVTLDDRFVILVTRGNPGGVKDFRPHVGNQKDPGALKVFEYDSNAGVLGKEASVTYRDGYQFGPRHLDFHPTGPWVYVSLETQNELYVYELERDGLAPEPRFTRDILSNRAATHTRQGAGTVHSHPNGRIVYCANRGHVAQPYGDKQVVIGADNTLVVYALDERTGEPTAIQHIDSHGICPRTFALDPSARMLVAANCEAHWVKEGDEVSWMPPNLAVFRVLADGRLEFKRKYDIELDPKQKLLWMGIVAY